MLRDLLLAARRLRWTKTTNSTNNCGNYQIVCSRLSVGKASVRWFRYKFSRKFAVVRVRCMYCTWSKFVEQYNSNPQSGLVSLTVRHKQWMSLNYNLCTGFRLKNTKKFTVLSSTTHLLLNVTVVTRAFGANKSSPNDKNVCELAHSWLFSWICDRSEGF